MMMNAGREMSLVRVWMALAVASLNVDNLSCGIFMFLNIFYKLLQVYVNKHWIWV
jgi:hypothetical protein